MRRKRGALGYLEHSQREALARWLFDDVPVLTYEEAITRLKQEFNVTTSPGTLTAFYQERARERMLAQMVKDGQAGRLAWGDMGRRPEQAFSALLEMVGRTAFEVPVNNPELSLDEMKELATVASMGIKTHVAATRLQLAQRELEIKEKMARIWNRDVALKERKYGDAVKASEPSDKASKVMTEEEVRKMVEAANFM